MAIQIALAWSPQCEKELVKKGFKKKTVYIKDAPGGANTNEQVSKGDSEFFNMEEPPYQFVTTSWWGRGAD